MGELLVSVGVTADASLERPSQVIYLPNRGDFYDNLLVHSLDRPRPLDPTTPLGAATALHFAASGVAGASGAAEPGRSAPSTPARGLPPAEVTWFNSKYTVSAMLTQYGYASAAKNNWRSPNQSSRSFATKVFWENDRQYWISLSGSDGTLGLGRPAVGGARWGDAFDLFVFYEHRGDYIGALREARVRMNLESMKARAGPDPATVAAAREALRGPAPAADAAQRILTQLKKERGAQ